MKKRILSLLLALALLCSVLPQIALPTRAEDACSGTCGENLTWRFDPDTGTLTIEGSGRMDDYNIILPFSAAPWNAFCTAIKTVSLPEELTSIGTCAFARCTGLTAITLPDGLTELPKEVFYECTGLEEILFPATLESIGEGAFFGCTGLKELDFPDGLTSIERNAFFACSGLTEVHFPVSLDVIDENAFGECIGMTTLELPDALTEIAVGVFGGCSGLTELTLPNHLHVIHEEAFRGCSGLTELALPDELVYIAGGAFESCTGLTEIAFPAGIEIIEMTAFRECSGLTAFSVPEESSCFSNDASGVLLNQDQSKLLIYPCGRKGPYSVPESVREIQSFAFSYCAGLTSITLPAGLSYISTASFAFCTGLKELTFPEGIECIDPEAFYGCTGLTELRFPETLKWIDDDAFCGCTGLTKLIFPEEIHHIGASAFAECTGLKALELPTGLTSVGTMTFSGCTGLTSVSLPTGITSIGWHAFENCTALTSVILPDGLTDIQDGAFCNCTSLHSVIVPKSVVEIGASALGYQCSNFWEYEPLENFTIYGYKGTAAQDYANENGFKFVPLDPASGFADVKPKHYYYNAMLWALERGITSGTSRVTFSPNDTCTRGQVMTFLYAAKGKPEADWSNNPFVDVKKNKYYFKPVLWAFQNGITNGVDDTHFQPNGGCTRAQVVTFLWALSGKPNPAEGSNPFKDVKKSNWYYKAVLWAYQNGITRGVDDTHFGPNQTCTRGQVVTFLYALLGKK